MQHMLEFLNSGISPEINQSHEDWFCRDGFSNVVPSFWKDTEFKKKVLNFNLCV